MNIIRNYRMAWAGALIAAMASCSNESPFMAEGDGTLRLTTEFRSDVLVTTRASVAGYDEDYLNDNLVVYIENSKGVIRKYLGKDQIPDVITLPVGKYVVEGWTGDSLSASFEKKFFRGLKKDIEVGAGNNSMSLKLDIANVVVAVDKSALQLGINDLKIRFYHSRGELVFTPAEIEAGKRGYFMMPNADTDLHYIIEGTNTLGEPFSKAGDLKSVERAHLYNFKLSAAPQDNNTGGGLIRLEIQDIPIIEERFEILPAPSFKLKVAGEDANLEDQLVSTDGQKDFKETSLRVLVYEGIKNLSLNFSSNFENMESISGVNLVENGDPASLLNAKNIKYQVLKTNDVSRESGKDKVEVIETWITFTPEFLNNLKESSEELVITVSATDARDYTKTATIKIANTESAVFHQDPVASEEMIEAILSPMAILANTAEVSGYIYDEEVAEYGVMYRKKNDTAFKKVPASGATLSTRADVKKFTVRLTGLEPGATYEYKCYADTFEEDDSKIKTFETEGVYKIPNADMSEWSTCNDVTKNTLIPNADGIRSFWDTGNHGSMSLGNLGGKNITEKDDSFIAGNTVAKLQSQFVGVITVGKFAAGNLFVGEFIKTVGTKGAQLKFGREYNGSHPSALKVKVNYRPGTVNYSENAALPKNNTDQGQIYVAIASQQAELNTADGVYFDETKDYILGYGQLTWDSNVGEDNQLETVTIPIDYRDAAKTTKATHLIIVCSASKYGDFFTGSSSSVMYLDDFELVYDEIPAK